jgi:outer membrane protein TolC
MTQQHFFIGIFLLLLLWTCTVSAQEPKTLTLEDSIQIARQTNLSIQTTQERVKSAEAQVRSVHAGLLPNVSLNSSYRYAKDLPKSVLEASGGFGPPGVGGEMPASTDTGGDDENIIELEFGAHHNFQAEIILNQPIFAWGRYYKSYQSAQLSLEAARKELDAAYNQLILDVSEAFYRVLLSFEFVKVSEQTVELVEKQLKIAQNLFEAGASTNFDILRAEVLLANARSNLIRAKNGARVAIDVYKNVLNIDLGESVEVEGSLERPILEFDLEPLIQQGLEKRPELHQFQFNEGAAKKQVDVAKTRNRPALSFFTNYQFDHNERLVEMNRIWNLGFSLNFPIFDGLATRAAVKQAESGLRQTQLGKQQMTDAIELEVRSAYLNLLEAKTLIDVQRETVAQAQESVRIANLRYENGMITSVELTDAQLALSQAEANRLQSLHDYAVGLARLEKAIGQKIPINNRN